VQQVVKLVIVQSNCGEVQQLWNSKGVAIRWEGECEKSIEVLFGGHSFTIAHKMHILTHTHIACPIHGVTSYSLSLGLIYKLVMCLQMEEQFCFLFQEVLLRRGCRCEVVAEELLCVVGVLWETSVRSAIPFKETGDWGAIPLKETGDWGAIPFMGSIGASVVIGEAVWSLYFIRMSDKELVFKHGDDYSV